MTTKQTKTRGDYELKPENFPLSHSYEAQWLARGNKRDCSYPSNGIPKIRANPVQPESSIVEIFNLKKKVD